MGKLPKSKILVVTRDKNMDNRLIEKCKADSRTNEMEIRVTEWVNYSDLKKEIYPIDSWRPTMVVITFDGAKSGDIFSELNADMGVLYQDRTKNKFKFKILHLANIFNPELCILLSTTLTDDRAVEQRMRAAGLKNKETTRVLVITGGHGGIKEDGTGQPLEHNGATGFTNIDFLEYQFYREDCETVGVAPRLGPVQNPVGEAQEKSATARPDCLMNDPSFDQMKFNVLNIKEFYKEGEGDADGLMKFIHEFKPTVLMISWCFSTTCDLAMMLRREGVFGTMFATFDLRTITGNPKAELSDQQRGVLENYRGVKDVVLAGPYGVGKTILLCELAKAAMAEKGWETAKVRIFHDFDGPTSTKLLEYLEDTFKPVGHRDVKVVKKFDLSKEFPGDSHLLVRLGSKMEEEGTRLIVVGDEIHETFEIDDEMCKNLSGFKHTKFLLALAAHKKLPNSLQKIVKLQSQYRNTEKILAFMDFQQEFVNEVRKTTGNPCFLSPFAAAGQADPGESLPKPLSSSPHPVVWLPVTQTQDPVRETIETMKCILSMGDKLEVAVLYNYDGYDHMGFGDTAEEICTVGERELGTFTWKHYQDLDYIGCEAPVVIILGDHPDMEYVSRARNQLVMVTTGEKMELTEEFYSRYKNRRSKFDFTADEEYKGDWRDSLQLSADLGKVKKMGDKRIFQTEFPFLELEKAENEDDGKAQ